MLSRSLRCLFASVVLSACAEVAVAPPVDDLPFDGGGIAPLPPDDAGNQPDIADRSDTAQDDASDGDTTGEDAGRDTDAADPEDADAASHDARPSDDAPTFDSTPDSVSTEDGSDAEGADLDVADEEDAVADTDPIGDGGEDPNDGEDLDDVEDDSEVGPLDEGARCDARPDDCRVGACVRVRATWDARWCAVECDVREACSEDFSCVPVTYADETAERVCMPDAWCRDHDGDGFGVGIGCLGLDCDDADPTVRPGAVEVCDGIDNDCDGRIDEGFEDLGIASCDGDRATGCETNIASNPAHCGACGRECPVGVPCIDGRCGCPDGLVLCEGVCRAANDCGGCGVLAGRPTDSCGPCAVWQCDGAGDVACVGPPRNACLGCAILDPPFGAPCGYCDTGTSVCDGNDATRCTGATTPLSDPRHCGACDIVCTDGRQCVNGVCECPATQFAFGVEPSDRSTCAGGDVEFVASVSGADVSLRWERSIDGGGNWFPVQDDPAHEGATTEVLRIRSVGRPLDGTRYRLRASGSCSTGTTRSARLSIDGPPSGLSAVAIPTPICEGEVLNLLGAGDAADAWEWSGPGGFVATSPLALRSDVVPAHSGRYFLTASNVCGERTTSTELVVVQPTTEILVQPETRAGCPGGSVSFRVEARGDGLTYRWQRSTNGGVSWSDLVEGDGVAGTTSPTLVVMTITEGMNGHRFRAQVSGACGSSTSASPLLNVSGCDEGRCGSAAGTSSPFPPNVGLCASGTPSAVGGTGPWTWTCSGGSGTEACAADRGCTGQPVTWSVGDATCSASLAGTPHAASVLAEDGGLPTLGSGTFACDQGVWRPGFDTDCVDLEAACPPFFDSNGVDVSSAEYLQGRDGAWYCVEVFNTTSAGTCQDRFRSVRSLTGPVSSCTSTERAGSCCNTQPALICSSTCTGGLCDPLPASCSFTCNGTSYLSRCRVP